MQLNMGQAMAARIAAHGVNRVFCVAGESYLPLLDALYDIPEVDVIATRHENGASYMAAAHARATGRPGVCMASRAPGAANLSLGLHAAQQDSLPVVAFVADVSTRFRGRESCQETDLRTMLSPHCKRVIENLRPDRAAEVADLAFRTAMEGRPGVVVVITPQDMMRECAEFAADHLHAQAAKPSRPGLSAPDLGSILTRLRAAEYPVIIAGSGVTWSRAATELADLATELAIPVIPGRRDVIPDDHPCRVRIDAAGSASAACAAQADLFLVIGSRLSEGVSRFYTLPPKGVPWIHLDINPGLAPSLEPPILALPADARTVLKALLAATRADPLPDTKVQRRQTWIRQWQQAWQQDYQPVPVGFGAADGINPAAIWEAITATFPDDAAICVDAGNFATWAGRHWRCRAPYTYFQSTAAPMGIGLPTAIAVQLANPGRSVVAVAGDGGFMMSLPELETAVRLKLPLVCIIFNNNMYGTIRHQQEVTYPGRVIGTTFGNPDFAALARAFGAWGEQVADPEQVLPALERASAAGTTAVVEYLTNPDLIHPLATISSLRRLTLR